MSALEQEIYEKFQQLDDDAKQRVLEHLNAEPKADSNTEKKRFDFDEWLTGIRAIQEEIRQERGADYRIDVVGLLREVREEEE
jgi:hypothetical protein